MREPFSRGKIYLSTLLLIEIATGTAILLITAIYHHLLSTYLADVERQMLTGQFFNTYLFGIQLIVIYLSSIAMWQRLWVVRCTPNVVFLLNAWLFFLFLIGICGFATICSLYSTAEAILSTAELALFKGVDMYYTCPEWKLLWDSMQYHKECCGVNNYKDWMKASWMPQSVLEKSEKCPDKKTTMVPYACCKHDCATCYENYMPRAGGGSNQLPYLSASQINTKGCLPFFAQKMWQIMYMLLFLVIVSFLIFMLIWCFTRCAILKQEQDDCGCSNMGIMDDDGRPLVVVKCPPNVRCVALEEEDGSNLHCSTSCACPAEIPLTDENRSYTILNECSEIHVTPSRVTH